jgi:hypothetical protein
VYLNVGTGDVALDQVYERLVRTAAQQERDAADKLRYQEGFQFFLLPAVVLLLMETMLSDRRATK